jgi:NO-binding membrane sensor protein with MHYT domain
MPGYYDPWTVFCSFLIACLAGFVAFEAVDHTRFSKAVRSWVFLGGVTLGLGIWSMHFMGMLAWHPPFVLYYSVGRTFLSVVVAICASWLALHLVAQNLTRRSLTAKAVGALMVGSGICAMHYIGMSALHFTGHVMWGRLWLLYSFLIAVVASWAAMEMLDRDRLRLIGLRIEDGAAEIAVPLLPSKRNPSYLVRSSHLFLKFCVGE